MCIQVISWSDLVFSQICVIQVSVYLIRAINIVHYITTQCTMTTLPLLSFCFYYSSIVPASLPSFHLLTFLVLTLSHSYKLPYGDKMPFNTAKHFCLYIHPCEVFCPLLHGALEKLLYWELLFSVLDPISGILRLLSWFTQCLMKHILKYLRMNARELKFLRPYIHI